LLIANAYKSEILRRKMSAAVALSGNKEIGDLLLKVNY